MKKFTLLAVGEDFAYQGEDYSKTGPLTAARHSDGASRMIPRHALVEPHRSSPLEKTSPASPATLDATRVYQALEQYHAGCLEWLHLAEQELQPETAAQIRRAMEQA
ncbi:MAG: hypothetical protein IBX49_10490, partial [Gammaproteobacteria bacterium]|nr:hypothetical protein [Gammaproteobacteria bacterium]